MRVMLVLVVMAIGCAAEPAPRVDTELASSAADGCAYANELGPNVSCFAIGSRCDAVQKQFCAEGLGWCSDGVCRSFCAETHPRCAAGTVERHASVGGGDLCVCVPG